MYRSNDRLLHDESLSVAALRVSEEILARKLLFLLVQLYLSTHQVRLLQNWHHFELGGKNILFRCNTQNLIQNDEN